MWEGSRERRERKEEIQRERGRDEERDRREVREREREEEIKGGGERRRGTEGYIIVRLPAGAKSFLMGM